MTCIDIEPGQSLWCGDCNCETTAVRENCGPSYPDGPDEYALLAQCCGRDARDCSTTVEACRESYELERMADVNDWAPELETEGPQHQCALCSCPDAKVAGGLCGACWSAEVNA